MKKYLSMQEYANQIGRSKSWVSALVARGQIKPAPTRLFDKPNSPLLFSPLARVTKNA